MEVKINIKGLSKLLGGLMKKTFFFGGGLGFWGSEMVVGYRLTVASLVCHCFIISFLRQPILLIIAVVTGLLVYNAMFGTLMFCSLWASTFGIVE